MSAVTVTVTKSWDHAGWVTLSATVNGTTMWVQAKVYAEPSEDYGINCGRISKMSVAVGDRWNSSQCVYSYDRGEDVCQLTPDTLDALVTAVENAVH